MRRLLSVACSVASIAASWPLQARPILALSPHPPSHATILLHACIHSAEQLQGASRRFSRGLRIVVHTCHIRRDHGWSFNHPPASIEAKVLALILQVIMPCSLLCMQLWQTGILFECGLHPTQAIPLRRHAVCTSCAGGVAKGYAILLAVGAGKMDGVAIAKNASACCGLLPASPCNSTDRRGE